MLHQRTARDVRKLIANALASDNVQLVDAHVATYVPVDVHTGIDGRQLIAQHVVLRYAGSRRQPSAVSALASCAVD